MPYTPLALTTFPVTLSPDVVTNYTYTNKDDDLATIKAAGYFDKNFPSTDNLAGGVKISDRITIDASDGSEQVIVTSVSPVISVAASGSAFSIIASFQATAEDGVATSTFAIPGLLPTDRAFVQLITSNSLGMRVDRAFPNTDELLVKFLPTPLGLLTIVSILVIR